VLCNIHAQEHPEYAATQLDKHAYGCRDAYPPKVVRKWASFQNLDSEILLVAMNDDGCSFDTIADYIKRKWKTL
jgi:hypothetical protein